jgi:hypothetical protein
MVLGLQVYINIYGFSVLLAFTNTRTKEKYLKLKANIIEYPNCCITCIYLADVTPFGF